MSYGTRLWADTPYASDLSGAVGGVAAGSGSLTLGGSGATGSPTTGSASLTLTGATGSTTYSATALALSPDLYLKLDEGSGSTTVADSSGNGHNGTAASATFGLTGLLSDGSTGTSVSTNGTSGVVSVANAAWMNTSTATVVGRFQWDGSSQQFIMTRWGGASIRPFLLYIDTDGKVKFKINDAAGAGMAGSTVLTANTSYTIAARANGSTLSIFVNGVLDAQQASGAITQTSAPFEIGRASLVAYSTARADEVLYWASALSDANILALHNAALGSGGGRVAGVAAGSGSLTLGAAGATGYPATSSGSLALGASASSGGFGYDAQVTSLTPKVNWKLSETAGATTAADASGNSHPGIINGSPTEGATKVMPSGVGSIVLASTAQDVDLAANADIKSAAFSVNCWYRPTAVGGSYQNLFNRDGFGARGWNLYMTAGKLNAYDGQSVADHLAATTLIAGTNYMATVTSDGVGSVKVYLNGGLDGTFTTSIAAWLSNSSNNNDFVVGASLAGSGSLNFSANGAFDHVEFYGYELTGAQVTALYAAATSTPAIAAVAAGSGSLTLGGSGAARATSSASGSLSLSASGSGQASDSASASLTLGGSGATSSPATASGSLSLSASGFGQASAIGSGSLALGASSAATASDAGSGSLTLEASGSWTLTPSSGSLTLGASGAAPASGAGSGSLALAGSGVATGVATATGSLSLSATGFAGGTSGSASLALGASGLAVAYTPLTLLAFPEGELVGWFDPAANPIGIFSPELGVPVSTAALTLPITSSASLTLAASGGARAPAAASGSLSLSGSGTSRAPAAASAAIDLTAAGSARTPVTASGSLSLSAAGSASTPITASGSLSLSGSGSTVAPASASGSLSLSGSGATTVATTASGSLSLAASGSERASSSGSASISLAASGAVTPVVASTASITLGASGFVRSTATAAGSITLSATGTLSRAVSSTAATITLGATGSAALPASGSASLTLNSTGVADVPHAMTATASLDLTAVGQMGVARSIVITPDNAGTRALTYARF